MSISPHVVSPYLLVELRTRDASKRLNLDALQKSILTMTGKSTDDTATWDQSARDLKLLYDGETTPPIVASFTAVGSERWMALNRTQAGDIAHVHYGLVPRAGRPQGHIAVLKDARQVLPVLRRKARRWNTLSLGFSADLHIGRAPAGIELRRRPSFLQILVGETMLKAAAVVLLAASARLLRTPELTPGVMAETGLAAFGVLLAFAILDWAVERRKTVWSIRGVS